MKPIRASERRALDRRLAGLDEAIGFPPGRGWIRTIRDALGMTTFDLATRMGRSQPRASQLERAEMNGSIKLGSLQRAAAAMQCRLFYVFVPEEPLVSIVRRQARAKATAELESVHFGTGRDGEVPDPAGLEDQDQDQDQDEIDEMDELVEARAYELIDSGILWRPTEQGSVNP
jgi:predicted DNA-binding mobile mystery protein A